MTDQEIIKALRCCVYGLCDECVYENAKIPLLCKEFLMLTAADRLEELTLSQHVMTMREDA